MFESPRWLLLKGKVDKAEVIVRQIAAINNKELPDDFNLKSVEIVSLIYFSVHMFVCFTCWLLCIQTTT